MRIPFVKMNGTGNDFIIIDGRKGLDLGMERPEFVRRVCRRRESIGADGVIFVEPSKKANFRWDFYNADGSSAEMCGNGSRCVARFAWMKRIAPKKMTFETLAGIIQAEVLKETVRVKLTDPKDFVKSATLTAGGRKVRYSFVNTGVPHTVIPVDDIEKAEVEELGRKIRYHRRFAPAGTNVNFISPEGDVLMVRTYERGVEGETLACGTGAVASAIVGTHLGLVSPPVTVVVRSGENLRIHFDPTGSGARNVFLEGSTALVCEGYIRDEALK
ncbi:MAG: diaminopimelate epimerase [Deltaproteobacteria bacterium]|nr:MAG: diaminopimelate epimerase [Deltaproteobacteria bacterium]